MASSKRDILAHINELPPDERIAVLCWFQALRSGEPKALALAEVMEHLTDAQRLEALEQCYGDHDPDELQA